MGRRRGSGGDDVAGFAGRCGVLGHAQQGLNRYAALGWAALGYAGLG